MGVVKSEWNEGGRREVAAELVLAVEEGRKEGGKEEE